MTESEMAKMARNLESACARMDKDAAKEASKAILDAGLHWVAIYGDGFWATNENFIINKVALNPEDPTMPIEFKVGKYDELFA